MLKNTKKQNMLYTVLMYIGNIVFLSPIMIYGGQNFSIDSYGIALDYRGHIEAFIGSYRWFGAFVYEIYYKIFNHNPITDSTVDCIVFIVLISAVVSWVSYTLYRLINKKSIVSHILINLSVLISVLNVWYCDVLSFPECIFITVIGTVLCFSAVIVFANNQTLCGYILSSALIILATGVYQQFLFVFTIFVVAICGCEVIKNGEKTFKELFYRYVKPVVLILVSGVIYFATGKLVQRIFDVAPNERVALSISTIIENCLYFAGNQHSYLKGRGFFATEILTISFLSVGFIWFIIIVKEWLKNRNTLETLTICASFAAAYISAYVPGILSTSHAARAMLAVFSVFALFTMGTLILCESKLVKIVLCAILSVVLVSNIFVFVNREIDLKKQNDSDKLWSEQIIEAIESYEKKEQEVNQIYYCYDDKTDLAEYAESAVYYKYSLRSMINYYSNREFEVNEMTKEEKDNYFKDKNWEKLDIDEQMVFVENTLYLCCY